MKGLAFGLTQVRREFKSGEVRVLAAALALAVAAMTAVGFFTDRVAQGVQARSAEVLAADLVVGSNRPIPAEHEALAAELGLATARTTSFPSVVLAGDDSALADIEGVSANYPLRGALKVSRGLEAESETVREVPPPGEAWADPRLLARLDAQVGATVRVGRAELEISRLLDYRPDQGFSFAELAPTLLINEADVVASGLVAPGSRVSYRLLLAGDGRALQAFRDRVMLGTGERLRGIDTAQPEIGNAVERAGRFIGLASLVSALIAAVAVAMAARRFASRRMDTVALMKCVGASRRFVLTAMLAQLAVVGLAASLLGLGLGWAAQEGLVFILADLVGDELPAPTLAPAVGGLLLAFVVLGGFALVPIIELCRTPPGRVLRRDMLPPAAGPLLVYGAAIGGGLALLAWQVRDAVLVGWLALGTAAVMLGLAAGGWLLVKGASRLRGGGGAWRYGMANVGRRGTDSIVQVGAFGIGLMVLLLLTLVRTGLLEQWQDTLPADAPNRFLINIQPHEAEGVREFLAERFGGGELVPLIRARLTEINGEPVEEIEFASPRAESFIDRESNLSWASEPAPDNRVVAGRWWPLGDESEVSVEVDFARDLGLELGDWLVFDVAGERLEAKVTSLRTVQWDTFKPNFFMVFPPQLMEDFPRTYISSIYVDRSLRGDVLELVRSHPSVTVIDLEAAIEQVRDVMGQASLAVQYVFLFALGAGLLVMLAVVQSTREERLYESAMLRTLGARKRVVLAGVAVEFAALGVISGVLAAAGASGVAWLLARRVFQLEFAFDPMIWVAGLLAGLFVVGGTGVLATRTVVTHPPANVLRGY
ncbi:FtsX-like permease family protein [Wenzhouxiangella sp. XN24]|uniref:ABC transporter permease n=1 Tax=Wenzhouxiangella sp. XN24 TaxID=2713569 RepID=UPI0013E9CCD6|nr:FtsX-like permease family protein [Wenzhouxiangella sp. XN24]NGX17424.1 FtsX-like permease family protein [Wenzhouxiangella sp. XN24]